MASNVPTGSFGHRPSPNLPPEKINLTSDCSYPNWHPVVSDAPHSVAKRAASTLVECVGVKFFQRLADTSNAAAARIKVRRRTLVDRLLISLSFSLERAR